MKGIRIGEKEASREREYKIQWAINLIIRAVWFYELAVHFNPYCCEAFNNLGVIYRDQDNLDKAIVCYQSAIAINPKFSQSLNNIGVVYTVQGKVRIVVFICSSLLVFLKFFVYYHFVVLLKM